MHERSLYVTSNSAWYISKYMKKKWKYYSFFCGPTCTRTILARSQFFFASGALHGPFIRKVLAHFLASRRENTQQLQHLSLFTCNKVCCLMWGISPSFWNRLFWSIIYTFTLLASACVGLLHFLKAGYWGIFCHALLLCSDHASCCHPTYGNTGKHRGLTHAT